MAIAIVVYLCTVLVCFILEMFVLKLGLVFDEKYVTLERFLQSILLSLVPGINLIVSILCLGIILDKYKNIKIF